MRILHYSDRSSPEFLDLYRQCDVLVTTGDLSLSDFASLTDIRPQKPAFGVYGNHDSGSYLETLGIINLHRTVVEFAGWRWGGFQGCLRYKSGSLMYTEEEAQSFADEFPSVDVLLLHAGPQDMLDDPSEEVHRGSPAIRRYILEKQPKFVFLGHQYSHGFFQVGPTKLFRTYGARIVEI